MTGINEILQSLNVPVGDLTGEDPRGRLDVLASRLIAHGVRSLPVEVQQMFHVARPLIDGQIVKHLGKFRVPAAPVVPVRKEDEE
jgi:hypothetical protein